MPTRPKKRLKVFRKRSVAPAPPELVHEFVITQLILRAAGFKSNEMTTVIREMKEDSKKSAVSILLTRVDRAANDVKRYSIGVGVIDMTLDKVRGLWARWVSDSAPYVFRNFDTLQKNSIAFVSLEDILVALEKAGFAVKDTSIEESFANPDSVH